MVSGTGKREPSKSTKTRGEIDQKVVLNYPYCFFDNPTESFPDSVADFAFGCASIFGGSVRSSDVFCNKRPDGPLIVVTTLTNPVPGTKQRSILAPLGDVCSQGITQP